MTQPEKMNFEYRRVNHSQLTHLTELIDKCFGIRVSDGYYDWKYVRNPVGKLVAFEALHEKNVAGFYGLIPEIYNVGGKKIKIYQSMDTMTHPNYQRRGLFVQLANQTFSAVLAEEQRLDMIGIPGGNSYHGFVHRLGWKCIQQFRFLFVNRFLFALRSLFSSSSKEIVVKEISSMTAELSDFLRSKEASPLPISPSWTPEFFSWRVFEHPYRNYRVLGVFDQAKLVGISVYALDERGRAYIYLLECLQQKQFAHYTRSIIAEIFAREKSKFIYTWEPTNALRRKAYLGSGFIFNPWQRGPFSYRVPFITRSETGKVNGLDWGDIKNFDLQPLVQD